MPFPFLLRCAALWLAFAAPAAAQTPAGLGDRLAACAACHGARGEGMRGAEYYPHLAGKPAGYLYDQLAGFRDGRRHYPQMTWLVRHMDDGYLREIAAFYAAQPPRTRAADAAVTPLADAARERAQALVRHGDDAAGLPACGACHGPDLAGLEPGIPALVGLPEDYLVAQLGAWKVGSRRAVAPDCMADIAAKLSPADIRALAGWLARQSHADGRAPAPAGAFVPPRACGTLPHAEDAP